MARCNCDSQCSCLLVGGTTECIEVHVTGLGSAANPYLITADFICLGPNAGGTLGYAEAVADQSGIIGETDLLGLSVAVTVGTGRRILITGECLAFSSVTDDTARFNIKEGANFLQIRQTLMRPVTVAGTLHAERVLTPSAGSHTYKLTMQRAAGTGSLTMNAGAEFPAFILVEDIGAA